VNPALKEYTIPGKYNTAVKTGADFKKIQVKK
jgi:hypothetical protein